MMTPPKVSCAPTMRTADPERHHLLKLVPVIPPPPPLPHQLINKLGDLAPHVHGHVLTFPKSASSLDTERAKGSKVRFYFAFCCSSSQARSQSHSSLSGAMYSGRSTARVQNSSERGPMWMEGSSYTRFRAAKKASHSFCRPRTRTTQDASDT